MHIGNKSIVWPNILFLHKNVPIVTIRTMTFQKILAGIIAILVIWVMWPHARKGEFLAPNPLPPNSWTLSYDSSVYAQAAATPPQGYGFRRFDFWNSPPLGGRPATTGDFRLRY